MESSTIRLRAVCLLDSKCISISEVNSQGIVVCHVATINETAVPQFLDDMQVIIDQMKFIDATLIGDGLDG